VSEVSLAAPAWRDAQFARLGYPWKGIYSVVSIAGFAVMIWGFAQARQEPVALYDPPLLLKQANAVFTLVAFILFVASYVPRNHFKAKLGHPQYASVKVCALGHLLATGMLHDVILFGAFLAWSIIGFTVSRKRDRAAGRTYPAGTVTGDVIAVVIGAAAWFGFAMWLHPMWIKVPAFV